MSIIATVGGVVSSVASDLVDPVGGIVSGVAGSAAGFVLQGISSWVFNGTKEALTELANAISAATAPNLDSTWFSSTYWRVAALAAMLTIPFLCAAAVQAVARGDVNLLARVAFGYLPLSILGVSLASPLTMLLLAATDQMSAIVSAGAATGGARFLDHAATIAGTLSAAAGGSPFFAVVVGLLTLMAAMALAVELLVRAAAVYVVVLMLPLAFAALVWPARRIWAVRLVELLASLILSKFVIVAVLSLAAAAFAHGTPGIGQLLVAMSLILLSTFAPWALMRILPFTELAAGAAGIVGGEMSRTRNHAIGQVAGFSAGAGEMAVDLPARLRAHARSMYPGGDLDPRDTPVTGRSAPPFDQARDVGADFGAAGPGADGPATAASVVDAPEDGGPTDPPAGGLASEVDPRPPYVPPAAWRGSEPIRLDEQLLGAGKPSDNSANGSRSHGPGRQPGTSE